MDHASMFNASSSSLSSTAFFWNGRNKVQHDPIDTDFVALLCNYTLPIFPTLAILVIISAVFFHLVKSSTRQSSVALPPGPQPWPLVGNLPELVRNGPGYKWVHSLLHSYATPILCVRLGSVHVIAVNRPDIAREFLKKQDAIFASRPITMASEYCSRGFLSVALVPWGDQWKKMRRALASEVLTTSRFNWLQGKRMEEADNLVHWIWNQCTAQSHAQPKTLINVRSAVRHYSANVIRKLLFNRRYFASGGGYKDGGPGAEEEEYVEALFKALSLLFNMCVSDYMPCLRWLDIGGNEKAMKRAIHTVDKYHTPLIEERFRLRRECTSLEEPQDLLDVLISIKDSSDGKPLLSLEEMKACAKEALRLHPVAPFNLSHMSMEDSTVAGYHIPKGSRVILSRVGLGRNQCV